MAECFDEKDCYLSTLLIIYLIGIVILVLIYGIFLKNQLAQPIYLSSKHSNAANVLSNCAFVASLAIFLSIVYEVLVLVRGLVFHGNDLEESNATDVFIFLTPMFYAAAKAVGFYYILRSTQLAYATVTFGSSSNSSGVNDEDALDFGCFCCTIRNGTKWSANGISELTIDQMSYLCVYFLMQVADAFGGGGEKGLYLGEDYNDFFRAIAVILEYLYLIFLIVFVFQRFVCIFICICFCILFAIF